MALPTSPLSGVVTFLSELNNNYHLRLTIQMLHAEFLTLPDKTTIANTMVSAWEYILRVSSAFNSIIFITFENVRVFRLSYRIQARYTQVWIHLYPFRIP